MSVMGFSAAILGTSHGRYLVEMFEPHHRGVAVAILLALTSIAAMFNAFLHKTPQYAQGLIHCLVCGYVQQFRP